MHVRTCKILASLFDADQRVSIVHYVLAAIMSLSKTNT